MVSKTSIPVVGNVRFNAVCAALIYSLVHSDTAFNYIIICFMQCSKWTVRRKEELQVGLLSWYSGGLRLRIITCYSINSVLIHSKGQVWLARAIFIWCFLTFISLVLPKIFLFFLWLWFGLFGFFWGGGGCWGVIYIFLIPIIAACRRFTVLALCKSSLQPSVAFVY